MPMRRPPLPLRTKLPIVAVTILLTVNIYVLLRDVSEGPDVTDDGVSAIRSAQMLSDPSVFLRSQSRLAAIEKVCAVHNQDEMFRKIRLSGQVIAAPDHSLAFCVIPKVACTYWKRVVRFINKDYEGTANSPDDINRVYTHFGPYNKTKVYPLNNITNIRHLNNVGGFKFMFTRDPYTRLWSGYLDKLFLPDFWWWLGKKVVDEVRENPSDLSLKCGHDVTFEEFLYFTADRLKKHRYRAVDMHFDPIHKQCNPCQMKFDVIGNIETFAADTQLILDRTRNNHVIKRSANVDREMDEIKMLTIYNYDILDTLKERGENVDCYNHLDIARRLWKTYQYNGYLSDSIPFPENDFITISDTEQIKKVMIDKLTEIRRKFGDETKSWSSQRRKYLEKAYKTISRPVLNAIRDTYALDFELFQYEKEPDYIFR